MSSKQIAWKTSAALAISIFTISFTSSRCTNTNLLPRSRIANVPVGNNQHLPTTLPDESTSVDGIAMRPYANLIASESVDTCRSIAIYPHWKFATPVVICFQSRW